MRILNIGCGNKILVAGDGDEVVNHDRIRHRAEITAVWDLNDLPWPWHDNSFDLIVACAVLEHLQLNLIESVNECWRILRRDGILYLKLPHWQSDNSYVDPTHYWQFSLQSLDVFDPATLFGSRYAFYTERKWDLVVQPKLNDGKTSFAAKMKVRKP